MTKRLGFLTAVLAWLAAPAAPAVINVSPGPGAIQAAIDSATSGDEIVVQPGRYEENLEMKNKDIILRSTDPTSTDVVAQTVIDGGRTSSVVSFGGAETPACVLSGFTITNGYATEGGGGGINGRNTHAVMRHNVITSNTAELNTGSGGGIFRSYGLIENNIIHNNRSTVGGAIGACQGDVRNNIIYDNRAESCGGIADNDSGNIVYNTIVGNITTEELAPQITLAGGLFACNGTIMNCILWGNTPDSLFGVQYSSIPTPPDYCCAEGGVKDALGNPQGTGNIDSDPLFRDAAAGDYRLRADSPCVDAGSMIAGLDEDFEGQARGYDGTSAARGDGSDYDIGADEYHPLPTRVRAGWFLYR